MFADRTRTRAATCARSRRTTVIALALVAALAVACAGGPSRLTASPEPEHGWYGGILGTPGGKPEFTLTDTSGRPFDFAHETDGAVTLLYYGYTHCPDVCPTHMATIAGALRALGPDVASRVRVVFVTTDPQRDTGPVIRAWLDHFDTRFVGLTGTVAEVQAAELANGMPPAQQTPLEGGGYAVGHASWVTVFAQDNRAHLVYPDGTTQDQWVYDLRKLVTEGWSSAGAGPTPTPGA